MMASLIWESGQAMASKTMAVIDIARTRWLVHAFANRNKEGAALNHRLWFWLAIITFK